MARPSLPVAVLLLLLASQAWAEEARLEAIRLRVQPRQLEAEGQVRLRLGAACLLEANVLRVGHDLAGRQVRLRSGELRLEANELRIDAEGRVQARHVAGELCGCRGVLSFGASRAEIGPGGRRLHLRWPVLRLGGLPVAILPYLPLPLRPGTSGLLLPTVGYSGRDGLRLEQGVYLAPGDRADARISAGWIQERGAVARARLRAASQRGTARMELDLVGLRDADLWRGSARGKLALGGERWSLILEPDLVSDARMPADLDTEPARVLAPYLRSRAAAWAGWQGLATSGRVDLLQALLGPLRTGSRSLEGVAQLGLALAPLRLAGPLHLEAEANLTQLLERGTLFRSGGALGFGERLGPVHASGIATYQLISAWSQLPRDPQHHLVGTRLEASLPLSRSYTRFLHRLEPLAALSWGTSLGGEGGTGLLQRLGLVPRGGGWTILGLRTELSSMAARARPGRRLEATLQLEIPVEPGQDPWLVAGRLHLAPLPRRVWGRISASWAPGASRLLELQSRLCGRLGPTACAGYTRLRVERVGQLFGERRGAWLDVLPLMVPLAAGVEADQLWGSLQARLGRLTAGGLLAGDPARGELAYGSLWLDVALGCGCLRAGLAGTWRAGQGWPDLALRLRLQPVAGQGCRLGR